MSTDAPVFLLGVERSGSTWLASMFGACADVAFVMEPLAPYALFAPGIPQRCARVCAWDAGMIEHLRAGVDEARQLHAAPPTRRERWLERLTSRAAWDAEADLAARLGMAPPLRALRRRLLNLHGEGGTMGRRLVVKELRLNLAAPLVRAAWPDARFVVALRDPLPQVASIVKQFERGGLREVQAALTALSAWAALDPSATARLGEVPDATDVPGRAAWYWAWQYDTLLRDLESAPHHVVAHEDISGAAEDGAGAIFSFAQLPFSDAVRTHVVASSTRERASDSPVDTQRVSAEYVEAARASVPQHVADAVRRTLDPLWEHLAPPLRRYAP